MKTEKAYKPNFAEECPRTYEYTLKVTCHRDKHGNCKAKVWQPNPYEASPILGESEGEWVSSTVESALSNVRAGLLRDLPSKTNN